MWTPHAGNVASWMFQFSNSGTQQVVFNSSALTALYSSEEVLRPRIRSNDSAWFDTSAIPAYAAVFSVIIFILHITVKCLRPKPNGNDMKAEVEEDVIASRGHIADLGGIVIFVFRITRLLFCLALFGLSFAMTLKFGSREHSPQHIERHDYLRIALTTVYAYSSLLALLSVCTARKLSNLVTRHLALLLGATWLVFAYRDLWPLATFTLQPLDAALSPFVWIEIGLLTVAGVVIPLLVPRQYIPIDPKDFDREPNPEQTCSLLSLMLYNFLDHVIFLAYRVPHLGYDKLPPLADYDETKNLVARSFKNLDPFMKKNRNRHMFFGLMSTFAREYVVLATMVIIRVCTSFASPLGIKYLLRYLETGGDNAVVRPWVWVSWLFFGPVLGSIAVQWYIFVATGTMVRTQGIITQLVFDHALRIRVKAETNDTPTTPQSTVPPTPDTASVAESPIDPNEPTSSRSSSEDGSGTARGDVSKDTKIKRKGTSVSGVSTSSTVVEKPASPGDNAKGGNLVGKINNLVTTDLNNIVDGRDFLFIILYIPVQVSLCVWFLYAILGWSSIVGLAATALLFPIPGFIANYIQRIQVRKMKKTDARVQTVTEIMNVIRMIKLFGWEPKVNEQVAEKREEELVYQKKFRLLEFLNGSINFLIPCVTMVVTFFTFTFIMKKQLSASIVFSSMAVFDLLRDQLHTIFGMLPAVIQAKVSLDRVNEFLIDTELLDEFAQKVNPLLEISRPEIDSSIIGFNNCSFTWSSANDGAVTPGSARRNFILRIGNELTFKQGHINLIVGATGSGKTSLLMALLGEMHYIPNGPDSYYNLPRDGGVAYASQESWVQNETIKDNILFGAPFDEERYNKVIYQCGLKRDLTLFDAGDETEVGEKGLTLSGGQKARITLARAVYSRAQILLLDDVCPLFCPGFDLVILHSSCLKVLAALDVHTAKWIVEKCFKGDLIQGRTVILVTHNVALASPVAEFVVSLSIDGRILSQGTLSKALAKNKKLSKELKQEAEELKKADDEIDSDELDESPNQQGETKKKDGKLIVAEEISEGHVGWDALKLYFASLGGDHFFLFWGVFLGGMTLTPIIEAAQMWFLGYWAHQYEITDPWNVRIIFYLFIYTLLLIGAIVVYSAGAVAFLYGCLRASRTIHKTLISSILGTTLRWLDKTPTSRVIARCTQDIQTVDGPIANYLAYVVEISISMLVKFAAVVVLSPQFLIPGLAVTALGVWCGQIYIKSQLSVKREMSNARAPVLGHFGAAMAGLTSIRAYGAQDSFKLESYKRINRYTRSARTFYNLNRWICIRIESLGGVFASGLAAYLVYAGGVTASNTGFSLTMAVGFSSMILWWVRLLNEFEVSGNSLERIQQYLVIEQEPKPTPDGVPPAYWPASGNLTVENLSARYSSDGPKVLQDISFHVSSGERVGIVGRTGSGKSSLTLSLLRCILTEGTVLYDGLPTNKLNLDALRSNITIIPQVPELLSGTLRQNLDPFSQHDDATLNDALRAAGLFSLQNEMDEGRITLDSAIASGGTNMSVGQRQILALARAIVRRSKLLILDEATSAIDYDTDTVIQTSLRKELDKDVTLLTVAHRLQTIMDADKIMVLDAGQIVEFGPPSELLKNDKGTLRALVDESGDRDTLYAMAAKASSTSTTL
ncbi:hypothetical protein C8Q75DRAFT_749936 [Abortiporus biennis]|nr:hypothetical protein C8Q75DRAFT_749936 [Abortiporus biennis]